jgi:beta,beta-carotene 9',10'-dioxygenase
MPEPRAGQPRYGPGFASLDEETPAVALEVKGALPNWLAGTLVRNGPAKFEAGEGKRLRHWFDGQAMLHGFAFAGGHVTYTSRFADTPRLRALRDEGRIGYGEFATDPCGSLFSRFFTRYSSEGACNPNVSVARFGGQMVALTEVPLPVEFDPATLRTLGHITYRDELSGQVTTAHPHQDPATGDLVNYLLRYARRSRYQVYRQPAGNNDGGGDGGLRRELIGVVPVDRPGYMHSFAITERYVVLAEYPLLVNPLRLLLAGKPFIDNFRWRPRRGTRFIVMDTRDGSTRGVYRAPAFFAFHHVNAFEDNGDLIVDLCAYDDPSVIGALYLDELRGGAEVPLAYLTRYRIDLDGGGVESARLCEEAFDLPRISYARCNGRPYRYAYGTGSRGNRGDDFVNQLVKADLAEGTARTWHTPGCYPGEPVFVPAPGEPGSTGAEDDGVILSVVLDAAGGRSFMLALDARDFSELARAEVPQRVPFGFHGQFTAS